MADFAPRLKRDTSYDEDKAGPTKFDKDVSKYSKIAKERLVKAAKGAKVLGKAVTGGAFGVKIPGAAVGLVKDKDISKRVSRATSTGAPKDRTRFLSPNQDTELPTGSTSSNLRDMYEKKGYKADKTDPRSKGISNMSTEPK